MSNLNRSFIQSTFLLTLSAFISPQTHATPIGEPSTNAAESGSTDPASVCSRFSENQAIYQACKKEFNGRPGVSLISSTSNVSSALAEAGDNWLILVNGSSGTISAGNIQMKPGLRLLGLSHQGSKPLLVADQEANSEYNIILLTGMVDHFSVENIHFQDHDPDHHTFLMDIRNPGNFTLAGNEFTAQKYSVAVSARCLESQSSQGTGIIKDNLFRLGPDFSVGIGRDCPNKNFQLELSGNHYHLYGKSRGIYLHAGGLNVKGDTYTQKGVASSSIDDDAAIAILFRSDENFHIDEETFDFYDDPLAYRASEITCSTFDGGTYGQLVPIALDYAPADNSDDSHNSFIIAHNIFRNTQTSVVDNLNIDIEPTSICNIWENEDKAVDRCHDLLPGSFLHFTDGNHCGEPPRGFQEPDCYAARMTACGTAAPLTDNPHIPTPPPVDWQPFVNGVIKACLANCQKVFRNQDGNPALPSLTDHEPSSCEKRCKKITRNYIKTFSSSYRAPAFYERKPKIKAMEEDQAGQD